MLPAANRIRRTVDFARIIRTGRRGGGRCLVVYVTRQRPAGGGSADFDTDDECLTDEAVRVGFVVSNTVGGSVRRHLVQRRLRAVVAGELSRLPGGADIVVRALPAAATAGFWELARELDTALERALR